MSQKNYLPVSVSLSLPPLPSRPDRQGSEEFRFELRATGVASLSRTVGTAAATNSFPVCGNKKTLAGVAVGGWLRPGGAALVFEFSPAMPQAGKNSSDDALDFR